MKLHVLLAAALAVFVTTLSAQVGAKFTVKKDVDYLAGQDYSGGRDQLDIYSPRTAKGAPVILWLHGPHLTGGERSTEAPIAERLAEAGIVVAVAGYRLTPLVNHPSHIEDVAAAFAWLKKNAAAHRGSSARVYVGGYSGGAYLAALLGSDPRYLSAHKLTHRDIAGLVLVAPTFNVATRPMVLRTPWGSETMTWRHASPTTYFGPHVPPLVTMIGDKDEEWRLEDNKAAIALLKKSGQTDATLVIVEQRDHETIRGFGTPLPDDIENHIIDFVKRPGARTTR